MTGSPRWRELVTSAVGLLVLFLAGVALQAWLLRFTSLRWPLAGGDALFWGARAVELSSGALVGARPPLYPALWVWAGHLVGVGHIRGGLVVAAVAGALVAPALAVAVAPVLGRRGAWLAGAGVLFLPDLQASSLRSDPTTCFGLLLALSLGAALRAALRRSVGWGCAAGGALAALALTKEHGPVYFVLLTLAVLPFDRRAAAAVGGVASMLVAPFVLADIAHGAPNVAHKVFLPFKDDLLWLARGVVPNPLGPSLVPGAADVPHRALGLFSTLLTRSGGFAGAWVPVLLGLGVVATVQVLRGRLVHDRLVLLGLPATGIVVTLLVPVQARHVETALVLVLPLAVYVADEGLGRARGLLLGLAGAWLGYGAATRLSGDEAHLLAAEAKAAASEVGGAYVATGGVPPGVSVCTTDEAAVLLRGRSGACDPETTTPPVYWMGRPGDLRWCGERLRTGSVVVTAPRNDGGRELLRLDDAALVTQVLTGHCAEPLGGGATAP